MTTMPAPPHPIPKDLEAERLARHARLMSEGNRSDAEDAFAELVGLAGPPLYAFLYRFLRRHETAEDVYQEVWLRVAQRANTFDGQCSFRTWLYRLARNACIDRLRRDRRRSRDVSMDPAVFDEWPGAPRRDDPALEAERRESRRLILEAVSRLPDAQREVFLLREEAGLPFDEIGAILGCGRETVKSRMRYALDKLRRDLEFHGISHGLKTGVP